MNRHSADWTLRFKVTIAITIDGHRTSHLWVDCIEWGQAVVGICITLNTLIQISTVKSSLTPVTLDLKANTICYAL